MLRKLVADAEKAISGFDWENAKELVARAAVVAQELHAQLKDTGNEPKHFSYMLENRGVPPSDPEFYRHLHPLVDLVAWLYGRANEDPKDLTLGLEFAVQIPCRRWHHPDVYTFKRTREGWEIWAFGIGGPCDKAGRPYLFQNLNHDFIQHPSSLGDWLERLWTKAEYGLSAAQLERGLQDLARWIGIVETSTPSRGLWKPG